MRTVSFREGRVPLFTAQFILAQVITGKELLFFCCSSTPKPTVLQDSSFKQKGCAPIIIVHEKCAPPDIGSHGCLKLLSFQILSRKQIQRLHLKQTLNPFHPPFGLFPTSTTVDNTFVFQGTKEFSLTIGWIGNGRRNRWPKSRVTIVTMQSLGTQKCKKKKKLKS